MLDAKSIQLLLESFNIKSKAYQESAGVAIGLTIGGLGSANIYVKDEDFENAQKIIALMEKGDLELPEIDDDLEFSDDEDFVDDSDEENN
jgi:hypothetical protein